MKNTLYFTCSYDNQETQWYTDPLRLPNSALSPAISQLLVVGTYARGQDLHGRTLIQEDANAAAAATADPLLKQDDGPDLNFVILKKRDKNIIEKDLVQK